LAASSYIGIKTASQGVKYAGGFGEMTTSQKILGGAGLAAGAAATYYTFNLGVTKFYSEWRGIIYSDLARSPAQVRGQEVYRSEEVSIYKTAAIRQSGVNKAITLQRTDVYPTGVDRVGFYARGVTKTTIYDPQYERYISSVETFRSSGYIPNIKEGVTFGSGGIKATPEGYFGGLGSGKYITQKNIKDFSFVAATKDEGQFYRVAGGVDPQRAFTGKITTGGSYYSTAIQARYDSSGIIAKLQDEGYSNIIITSGAKSSQAYFNNLYGVGAAGSAQITKQAGTLAINDLVNTVAPSSTQAISSQAASQAIKFNFAPQVSTSSYSQEGQIGYTLPALSQLMPQTERESSAVININNASFADLTNVGQRGGTTPAFAFAPALATATAQGLRLRQGMLNPLVPTIPNYFNPPDFTDRGGKYFDFDLGGLDIGLPSQIIKGGKRKTGYTPSFSALVFNLRGAYSGGGAISKSGIDFRPITRGFAFNTGVGGIGAFRKLLKRK